MSSKMRLYLALGVLVLMWGWFSEEDFNVNGFRRRLGVEDMVKSVKN